MDQKRRGQRHADFHHRLAWEAAVQLGEFTYQDLALGASIYIETASKYVQSWRRLGLVEGLGIGVMRRKRWRLTSTTYPAGSQDAPAAQDASVNGNLWRSMRGLRTFSAIDLAAHSDTPATAVTIDAARKFCAMLVRAEYLLVEREGQDGLRETIYRLVRNTGPRPPAERRVLVVYDENLDSYTHVAWAAK